MAPARLGSGWAPALALRGFLSWNPDGVFGFLVSGLGGGSVPPCVSSRCLKVK